MKCKTLLKSSTGENYTASVEYNKGRAIIVIHAAEGTFGEWIYYLESLLGLGEYSSAIGDKLMLDLGQKWSVTGMRDLLKEVINHEARN